MSNSSRPTSSLLVVVAVLTVVGGAVAAVTVIWQSGHTDGKPADGAQNQQLPRRAQSPSPPRDGSAARENNPANKKEEETPEKEKDGEKNKRAKPKWDRPRFEERRTERHRMVRDQIADRGVTDEEVLEAMRHVPRHKFVPDRHAPSAYADRPLPIGHGQTISQPYIVAFMTEQIELEAGDKVLEIGTGSAYQAAVLSEITPHVYSIEIIQELAKQAAKRLDTLGYDTVEVKAADGYFGWKKHGPFDAIIVTAAAGHIPPPLVKQLKKGGRMIIPVGGTYEVQYLILVEKNQEGELRSNQLMPVRFVPMTGRAQEGK
jgi:protein-L-isoaspartate(D-aspartate) O-methyltransferase